MKHIFHYGNIFKDSNIEDARKLEGLFNLKEGKNYNPTGIGEQIQLGKKAVEKRLNKNVSLSLIDYPAGFQYLDIFILGKRAKRDQQNDKEFTQNISLPSPLEEKWNLYQEIKSNAVINNIIIKQDIKEGHWLSEYAPARKIEEFFLKEMPSHLEEVISVLQHSSRPEERIAAAYLIQWQPNKELAVNLLLKSLEKDPHTGVHNEAARALIALLSKVKIKPEKANVILNLLFDTSSLAINKGLNLIAKLCSENILELKRESKYYKRISALTTVRQPCVAKSARVAMSELKKFTVEHI